MYTIGNTEHDAVQADARDRVVAAKKHELRQLKNLNVPGLAAENWIEIGADRPTIDDVMLIKREQDQWIGAICAMHNGSAIVALVLYNDGTQIVVPMIEDGAERSLGITHWQPWPGYDIPALAASFA